MTKEQAEETVADVFALYENFGGADYIGELVSQAEHMHQAARLAEAEGYGEDMVLAALFHDIGHLVAFVKPVQQMDGMGVVDHEGLGAAYLRECGFGEALCQLVQSHVQAKRYLTFKYPDYYTKLSPASKITLQHQGGVMDDEEAKTFEEDPLHPLYIKMREWDDWAKLTGQPAPDFSAYKKMALRHLVHQPEAVV